MFYEKSRFFNIHGAIVDHKYKTMHDHDDDILTQTIEFL